jgi:hypothetical protein
LVIYVIIYVRYIYNRTYAVYYVFVANLWFWHWFHPLMSACPNWVLVSGNVYLNIFPSANIFYVAWCCQIFFCVTIVVKLLQVFGLVDSLIIILAEWESGVVECRLGDFWMLDTGEFRTFAWVDCNCFCGISDVNTCGCESVYLLSSNFMCLLSPDYLDRYYWQFLIFNFLSSYEYRNMAVGRAY